MNKGELRKLRKERTASGKFWNIELSENGQLEVVRPRTRAEENRHERDMDRWARQNNV